MEILRGELIRDASIWLQAERISHHGQGCMITTEQDHRLRVAVYLKLSNYYTGRVPGDKLNDIRRALSFILFEKNERMVL